MLKRGKKPTGRVGEKNPREEEKMSQRTRSQARERTLKRLTLRCMCCTLCRSVMHHRTPLCMSHVHLSPLSPSPTRPTARVLPPSHSLTKNVVARCSHVVAPIRAARAFAISPHALVTLKEKKTTHQKTTKKLRFSIVRNLRKVM